MRLKRRAAQAAEFGERHVELLVEPILRGGGTAGVAAAHGPAKASRLQRLHVAGRRLDRPKAASLTRLLPCLLRVGAALGEQLVGGLVMNRDRVRLRRVGGLVREKPDRLRRRPVDAVGHADPRLERLEFGDVLAAAGAENRGVGCMHGRAATACQPLLEVGWLEGIRAEDLPPCVASLFQFLREHGGIGKTGCGHDLPVVGVELAAVLHVAGPGLVVCGRHPAAPIETLAAAIAFKPRLGHPAERRIVGFTAIEPLRGLRPEPVVIPLHPSASPTGSLVVRVVAKRLVEQSQGLARPLGEWWGIDGRLRSFVAGERAVVAASHEHGVIEQAGGAGPPRRHEVVPDRLLVGRVHRRGLLDPGWDLHDQLVFAGGRKRPVGDHRRERFIPSLGGATGEVTGRGGECLVEFGEAAGRRLVGRRARRCC